MDGDKKKLKKVAENKFLNIIMSTLTSIIWKQFNRSLLKNISSGKGGGKGSKCSDRGELKIKKFLFDVLNLLIIASESDQKWQTAGYKSSNLFSYEKRGLS